MTQIKKVAVIGAGTMGGGIAAHCINAGLQVVLLDAVPPGLTPDEEKRGLTLESKEVRNRFVKAGLERIKTPARRRCSIHSRSQRSSSAMSRTILD